MWRRHTTKKRNFSEAEIETLTSHVQQHKVILFGSLKSGIKGSRKNEVWKEITAAVNSVAADTRTPSEVKKKWSNLKLATKMYDGSPEAKHHADWRRPGGPRP
ncbi:t-SNARE domain-containing protein 1-like [Centropristis striata]|uniref:t-SNARE domain-containing protein 1-like n=1 Tax=Centropristis striata TaxID=184440 RepID=UPI0027E1B59E|nr:t-SNARE domain-containing protein 1-like [Centropristis striata]